MRSCANNRSVNGDAVTRLARVASREQFDHTLQKEIRFSCGGDSVFDSGEAYQRRDMTNRLRRILVLSIVLTSAFAATSLITLSLCPETRIVPAQWMRSAAIDQQRSFGSPT